MEDIVQEVLQRTILYFSNDVKRINHLLKVYSFAKNIAVRERLNGSKLTIVEIASIMHDIGIKNAEEKYSSSSAKYQQQEGPAVAREILSQFPQDEINDDIVERVCYIIGNHHTYTKIDGIDFQILVEADFLVNIFEDNLIDVNAINSIMSKYFKTSTGRSYIKSMYIDNKVV